MEKLELIVFNVGHGLSVALIERPENYVTLIDLGCSENFSPINYLINYMSLYPDILYITHPHGDHIKDISNVICSRNPPSCIFVQDYDWNDVEQREKADLRDNLRIYVRYINQAPRGVYSGNARLTVWRHTPEDAKRIFGESTYINNSSLFIVYAWKSFKIAIPGDIHSNAMEGAFLKNNEGFKTEARDTDLLIAPHHGHKEGYSSLWAQNIGKPYMTLISVQGKDPHVATGYSSPDFAHGVTIDGQKKYTFTTREKNAHIRVFMSYDQQDKPSWSFSTF